MEPTKIQIPIDIVATKMKAQEMFEDRIETANKLWHDILRLIITLASSFLVLTIALVDKLFPNLQKMESLSLYITAGWIFLFASVVFGIIAALNEIVFISNHANSFARVMKDCNKKLSERKQLEVYSEDDHEKYRRYNTIIWGLVSINSFLLAITCICIALLEKFLTGKSCYVTITVCIIFLIITNLYLLGKREKE